MNDPTPRGDNELPATDSGARERYAERYGVSEHTTDEPHAGTSSATARQGDELSVEETQGKAGAQSRAGSLPVEERVANSEPESGAGSPSIDGQRVGNDGAEGQANVPPAFDTVRDDDNPLEKLAKRLGFLHTIRAHPVLGWMYRAGVAVVGGFVVIVGIILIPAPGPGWLIVFAGLGILATEFAWAQRVLDYAKSRVAGWTRWIMKQRLWVRCAFGLAGVILLAILAILSLHSLGWDSALFT